MPRLTLKQAIDSLLLSIREGFVIYPQNNDLRLLLAAAKAFACEECNGTGIIGGTYISWQCPACAEYRKIAMEGVEG